MTQTFDRFVVETERLLREMSVIIKKRGRDILEGFDITPPQFDALLALRDSPDMTMGELCQKMYLACSTATDLIDRMERNGLISREKDATDRRVIRLKMRERGYQIIEEVMIARKRYVQSILDQIDMEEKENLIRALTRLHGLMMEEIKPGTRGKEGRQ